MSNGTLFPICWGELPTETGHPQKRLLSPFLEGSLGSWESDGITFGQEPPYEGVSPVKDHILWLGPQGMKMGRMLGIGANVIPTLGKWCLLYLRVVHFGRGRLWERMHEHHQGVDRPFRLARALLILLSPGLGW